MGNRSMPNYPVPADRMQNVLDYIQEHGSVQIKELSALFHVSESTIRRDMDELAVQGLVERTHGGAISIHRKSAFERAYDEKMSLQLEEKRRIAEAACKYVQKGDTIFLDSGTTAYHLALCLADKEGLTVITHDIYLAANVEFDPSTTVVLTGGIIRANHKVLIGAMVEDFISDLKLDTVFLTADAISATFGVSNAGFYEVGIKRNLVKAGKQVVLLADHTKFDGTAVIKVCDITDIDCIVTDKHLPQSELDKLEARGVKVELA